MVLAERTCATRWTVAKQHTRKYVVQNSTDLLTPFGEKVSCRPISSKDKARLHQSGKKMLPNMCMGDVLRADGRWSGDLLIAVCEDHENPSASNDHVKQFKYKNLHTKESCCFHVQTDLSVSSIFLNSRAAKCLPGEPLSRMKKEKKAPFSNNEKSKYLWSMCGDFIYIEKSFTLC